MSLKHSQKLFPYFLDFEIKWYAHINNRILRLFCTSHHSRNNIESNWLLHLISGRYNNPYLGNRSEILFVENCRSIRVGKSVLIDVSPRRNCAYNRFLIIRIYFQVYNRCISRFMFFNIRYDFIDTNLGRDVDRYLFSQI